jgi:hypothetical protein
VFFEAFCFFFLLLFDFFVGFRRRDEDVREDIITLALEFLALGRRALIHLYVDFSHLFLM